MKAKILIPVLLMSFVFAGCAKEASPERDMAAQVTEGEAPADMKKEAPAEMEKTMVAKPAAAPMKRRAGPGGSKGKADKGEGKDGGKPKTWKRSTLMANTSRLMIGDREELKLNGMQIHARLDGFRARVLIDFYFHNDRDRQFEGTFKLRLPEGASPYFLAFGQSAYQVAEPQYEKVEVVRRQGFGPREVMQVRARTWEKTKEARMVPKEKAAYAYKETVRRRVDPALMEWSGAGVFSSRIFPIVPRKLHRVVVGYDMDLTRIGGDLEFRLPVPEGLPSSVVDLDIAALKGAVIQVSSAKPKGKTKGAEPFKEGSRQHYRLENVAGQVVTVRLNRAGQLALTGQEPTGAYFATRLTPKLPAVKQSQGSQKAVFMVDTSLSANPDGFNVWLQLLEAVLANNRKDLREFAVLFFNVETFWWQNKFVGNTPANVKALMAFTNSLALEGATDLGAAIKQAAWPAWVGKNAKGGFDIFLLSDGAITWGEGDPFSLSKILQDNRRALFAYRTGMAGADTGMLDNLARESGGGVFSVVGESEIQAASTAHTARPWEIRKVEVKGISDLLVAGRPRFYFPGQRLVIAGRGKPKQGAQAVLRLRQADREQVVKTPLARVLDSELAPRIYGQLAVAQLEDFMEATQPQVGAFARHFRVTGKSTSLLMLETEQDYLRFKIEPKNDAKVIREKLAKHLLANALDQLAQLLGDAKAAFLARLKKLKTIPGVNLNLTPAFHKLLNELPRQVFEVETPRLVCKSHSKKGMQVKLAEQLSRRKPEYDTVSTDAQRRRQALSPADGLKSLSSLVEASPGDGVLARDIGFTAMDWGLPAHAYHLFRRVAESRPFEPQTYRALALSLAKQKSFALALAYYEIGLAGQWDSRFGEFRRILLLDYLRFLGRTNPKEFPPAMRKFARGRLGELRREMDVKRADLLVSITWNTDNTDVDLHVIEPSGEECYYSHPNTKSGGQLTDDVTQGYGPEMYLLKKAPQGLYRVRAKYFSSDAARASARTKVYATIYRNWGTPQEKVTTKVVTLEYGKEMHDLAKLKI